MPDRSYVAELFRGGLNRIAQKVGEEAIEVVIAAKDEDLGVFRSEAADLFFHLLVLMNARGIAFSDLIEELKGRDRA